MPYKSSKRLPGEYASKIGHLSVIKNQFVQKLVHNFKIHDPNIQRSAIKWVELPKEGVPLKYIFVVDGSVQPISATSSKPIREIAFI